MRSAVSREVSEAIEGTLVPPRLTTSTVICILAKISRGTLITTARSPGREPDGFPKNGNLYLLEGVKPDAKSTITSGRNTYHRSPDQPAIEQITLGKLLCHDFRLTIWILNPLNCLMHIGVEL